MRARSLALSASFLAVFALAGASARAIPARPTPEEVFAAFVKASVAADTDKIVSAERDFEKKTEALEDAEFDGNAAKIEKARAKLAKAKAKYYARIKPFTDTMDDGDSATDALKDLDRATEDTNILRIVTLAKAGVELDSVENGQRDDHQPDLLRDARKVRFKNAEGYARFLFNCREKTGTDPASWRGSDCYLDFIDSDNLN
jgi:hypothetical protein